MTIVIIMAMLINTHAVIAQNEGDNAPAFSYVSTEGDTLSLSDFKNQVVVIFLFGYDCPYCLSVGNETETKIHQAYKSYDDFGIIGLDTWDGSKSQVNSFKEQTNITYPLGLKAGEMEDIYSTSYDRFLIIDREGKIAHKGNTGASNDLDNVIAELNNLLKDDATSIESATQNELAGEIYPNPVESYLNVKVFSQALVDVQIFNTLGNRVKNLNYSGVSDATLRIEVQDLPAGYYIIQFNFRDEEVIRKFMISRN